MFLCRNYLTIKWLLFCSGNSNKNGNATHLEYLSYVFALYTLQYANITILDDLSVVIGNSHREVFCNNLNSKSLIAEPTFYENPNPSFLYRLFLTNRPRGFQNCFMFETVPFLWNNGNENDCNENGVSKTSTMIYKL